MHNEYCGGKAELGLGGGIPVNGVRTSQTNTDVDIERGAEVEQQFRAAVFRGTVPST